MLNKNQIINIFEYKDGELIRRKNGNVMRSTSKEGYYRARINNKNYLVHRLIFMMHHGYLPKIVDHINGNTTDNRIENLRAANDNQNVWNRRLNSNSLSKIKGIRLQHGKWSARIQANKKSIYLGLFNDLELAELVVMEARDKYHVGFVNHG